MSSYFLIRKDQKARRTTLRYATEREALVAADRAIENERFIAVWVTDGETGAVLYEQHAHTTNGRWCECPDCAQ